jgi:hypothetical protein
MTRALLHLVNDTVRARAHQWIDKAPPGTRVEFKAPQRSPEQNSMMWALLTDIATQKKHHGRRYTADAWKAMFLHALGQEVIFLPSLDGATVIPYGRSSSDLSKEEMSELIELILAWGAENGVVFTEGKQ